MVDFNRTGWRTNLLNNSYFFDINLKDVYEFGVYTGQSLVEIDKAFQKMNILIRKLFALDSYEGMPEETKDVIHQEDWKKGNYSTMELYNASNPIEASEKLKNSVNKLIRPQTEIITIEGFYENILNNNIIEKYDFKPAIYVDIDCDIYSSTYEVLNFMVKNNLIVKGTIIGYDDWGGTKGWREMKDGESRAHKEIQEKYNIEFEEMGSIGTDFPHVHKIFKVINIK